MNDDTNNQILHTLAGVPQSVYKTNNQLLKMLDGIIDQAGNSATWGNIGGDLDNQSDLIARLDAKQALSEKGQANGYVPLNASTQIDLQYLPSSTDKEMLGFWDASTNTPSLADGPGAANDAQYYIVEVAGTQDLGSGSQTFNVGDDVVFHSSDNQWHRVGRSDAVSSVNGKTGVVVLDSSDVGAVPAAGGAFTGAVDFQFVSTDTEPSVKAISSNPQIELRRTTADADEKRWNFSTDPDQLSLVALSDDGNTLGTAWLITRSGASVTAHSFHVGGDSYLSISNASDIVASVDLHMSDNNIDNLKDATTARQAVNLSQLDAATSNLKLADGSTGAPSLAFASDPTTGLYFSDSFANDPRIAFSVAGTQRMFLNTAGLFMSTPIDNTEVIGTAKGFEVDATGHLTWSAQLSITSPGVGELTIDSTNGGYRFKASSDGVLEVHKKNDTSYATVQAAFQTNEAAVAETPSATHTLTLTDGLGAKYKVLAVAA